MSFSKRDGIAIVGFISFLAGIYILFGIGVALIIFGLVLMVGAIWTEYLDTRRISEHEPD